MSEPNADRLKRLRMRSMRRGIKEMDLILSSFCERHLSDLSEAELREYDALLSENDQDLYQWVTEQSDEPARFQAILSRIRASLPAI